MKRKTLPCIFTAAIAFISFFAPLNANLLSAREQRRAINLYQLLEKDMNFSQNEFQEMKEYKVITKRLRAETKHELAVFGIVRFNVPREFFIQNYRKDGMNIETATVKMKGEFSDSPGLDDLRMFSMSLEELKDLAECKPCDCKVKVSTGFMEKFRQLDKFAPDFQDRANILIRKAVLEYIQKYLKKGNDALIVYYDKENPIHIAKEFQELLDKSQYIQSYAPELHKYLEKFPESEPHSVDNVFYWAKENFGGKAKRSIININHDVFYQRPGARNELIVASKQLYATHYYEAALGLTMMIDDPENNEPGFYLMHLNRSRIDVLREIPGFLAKRLFKRVNKLLHTKMSIAKKNMEGAYRATQPTITSYKH
ncbi:MAG: hypothetical protein SV375_05830 [Thermodesulfobacteriota bacterium]|nr:hypothetical protein [Thermodesulfobacteriota bacterium]